nr:hypothetical protein [Staphylococcus sp. EG-SA-17]
MVVPDKDKTLNEGAIEPWIPRCTPTSTNFSI